MENKIRRTDREISATEAKKILEQGEYGVLSTVSEDGHPYGIPISYRFTGDAVYFHGAVEGHKLRNLAKDNRVSFCVVGKTEILPGKFGTRYESAILFGKAVELTGEEKHRGLVLLLEKYSSGYMEKGLRYIEKEEGKTRVFKIHIESLSGKARRN